MTYSEDKYPMSGLTERIIGCALEVHRTLGPGFEEVFYQRALLRELTGAGIGHLARFG
jgi:GxxExxY protein